MSDERDDAYGGFHEAVNMTPAELERWLETEESRAVGDSSSGGESAGHRSGRRVVQILRTRKGELRSADHGHMREVVGYIRRHLAQRPDGDVTTTPWRYSHMNWGHDPLVR
ncbi:DUF3140 domain-containing protein [Microcella alkalica]|uniref:DUF3140 domain-containing protein n=1 Tax=Microcella alkalica TaxID=355930 RepID=A0A839E3G4_9MICO|nr:DUF3140 domain-containing protein [Microcella alkalica]MBA8847219.1 hypothetical protein [Microcella alkalica]